MWSAHLTAPCTRFSPILAVMCAPNSDTNSNVFRIVGLTYTRSGSALKTEKLCGGRNLTFNIWSSGRLGSYLRLTVIFLAGISLAQAQESPSGSGPSSVRVHGSATVSVEPDLAQFDIGVVTQATTAKAATDQNASRSNALVGELRAAFPEVSIKGVNFSVNPNYEYPREGTPTIAGYTASNTVRLLLNDLSKLQTVIGIAIRSGANSINRLSFTIRDENSARGKVLAAAALQAQAGAEALAASLDLRLTRLRAIDESQPVIVSPAREFRFENIQSTVLAPVSPGTIDVHADVDFTWEATPRAQKDNSKQAIRPKDASH